MPQPKTTPGAKPKGPSATANVAKMIVSGQGETRPANDNDLSYLENVVEAAPEGSFDVIDAVEVTSIPNPANQSDAPDAEQQAAPDVPKQAAQETPEQPTPTAEEDEIDDPEYKGKSKKDIVAALKNLRTEYGRQSNEVGDYRRYFDQFVLKQAQANAAQQTPPPVQTGSDGDDDSKLLGTMLESPVAYKKLIINEVFSQLHGLGVQNQIAQMDQANSDLFTDPTFSDWLRANVDPVTLKRGDEDPKVRSFIFNSYRSMTGKQAVPAATNPTVDPRGAMPTPRTNRQVTVSSAAAGAGTANKPAAATFSRKAMRQLAFSDSAKYRAMEQEYARAIQDGRVTD